MDIRCEKSLFNWFWHDQNNGYDFQFNQFVNRFNSPWFVFFSNAFFYVCIAGVEYTINKVSKSKRGFFFGGGKKTDESKVFVQFSTLVNKAQILL